MQDIIDDNDLPFEEEVVKNPYNVKAWWQYFDFKRDSGASFESLNVIFERALKYLPGSYKIWMRYLKERMRQLKVADKCITDSSYQLVNNTFERALVYLHKMPRLWLTYLEFLNGQLLITKTRHAYERALKSLPVMQHPRIWEPFIAFVKDRAPSETTMRIFRRYLKIEPGKLELYVDYLKQCNEYGEACELLIKALNDENFVSTQGRSRHDLWEDLCDLMSSNPEKMGSIPVDAIIRSGIKNFSDETGKLWCALADFYTRSTNFEKARDVYEEGIASVTTVRDFSQIFDAYSQFEESMASAQMEAQAEGDDDSEALTLDLDLRLARLEDLMERRPLLVSSVVLRQNPHNVVEWHKRVRLMEKQGPAAVIQTYSDAVRTVNPMKATGKPHTLWVSFAKYYLQHGDIDNARLVFDKATKQKFKTVDDLGSLWCEYAETEVNKKHYDRALKVMQQATLVPKNVRGRPVDYYDEKLTVQERVHKHVKLWSFYVDLMESLGTFEQTKALYERIVDLRIATPQILINFASFLEENKFYEEAFRVYERGINLFTYPHSKDLWLIYLTKFCERYGNNGNKLERIRDLFEQAVEAAPPKFAKPLYLLYGKLEEEHGLASKAMEVYLNACERVPDEEKLEMYQFYIYRAREFFSVTQTRAIYDKAINTLPDAAAKTLCLQYAALEQQLGEIDRARATLVYGSQLANPKTDPSYWKKWEEFEVEFGNTDTFKEMTRIKRSVQAAFSTNINYAQAEQDTVKELAEAAGVIRPTDAMAELEMGVSGGVAFTAAKQTIAPAADAKEAQEKVAKTNPEAIVLDDEDEDEDMKDVGGDIEVEEVSVPAAVFGDAMKKAEEERKAREKQPKGALARFRAKAAQ